LFLSVALVWDGKELADEVSSEILKANKRYNDHVGLACARVTVGYMAEPVASARQHWDHLELQVEIAIAYCESEFEKEADAMAQLLREIVHESSQVELFRLMEMTVHLAKLESPE
jgi:hypothetical protein